MNYALGHALNIKDLFRNFNTRKLKMSRELCLDIYSDGNKKDLAAKIFAKSMEKVILDIIDNNTHFKLPGNTESYIFMKRTEGESFKKAFKNGKWRDIDFIESNFCGYLIFFNMLSNKRLPRLKPVYLSPKLKQKIVDNTNSGKLY